MNLRVLADRTVWRVHLRPYRAGHWWRFKIPPTLAAVLGFWVLSDLSPGAGLLLSLAAAFTACCAAAFGHAVNEYADIRQDALAGRANTMAPLGPVARFLSPAVPLLAAFSLAWALSCGPVALAILALEFFLAAAYSLPPLRAKERGGWGILAEGAATMAVPSLFAASLFFHQASPAPRAVLFAGAWAVLALALGIKGILWHQDLDREQDQAAGVRTFGASHDHEEIRFLLVRRCYPVEMAALVLVVGILLPTAPLVAVFFVLHGLMEAGKWAIGWRVAVGTGQERYLPFINNFFYELPLPFALALTLAAGNPWGMAAPVALALLFYGNIPQQAAEFMRFDASIRQWLRARGLR